MSQCQTRMRLESHAILHVVLVLQCLTMAEHTTIVRSHAH